jgi:aminomethyltransferase
VPIPSPFHERTQNLCRSYRWKDWAGYYAVCAYDTYPEREYFAIRHAAALLDVTPLFKYDVHGPDAAAALARIVAKNVAKLKVGQVAYCCWCDERGKLLDDGTVTRLEENAFRVTAAEPNLAWFTRNARGYRVTIEDVTHRIAAVSLQGPTSRLVLEEICDADLSALRFFRWTRARIDGFDAIVTRTGYTGDLGYEVWVENEHATSLWDALMAGGRAHGIEPTGLDALDVARIEAGFIMNGVDYYSANHCLIEARKSTPFEADLGWTLNLKRDPFVGQAALAAEKARGPNRRFVGLELDWDDFERHFAAVGLPPEVHGAAWRTAVPVFDGAGQQVGQATSGAWSPMLKKNLALATVRRPHGDVGEVLSMEVTVEYVRHRVKATVAQKPFFDPPRKRA